MLGDGAKRLTLPNPGAVVYFDYRIEVGIESGRPQVLREGVARTRRTSRAYYRPSRRAYWSCRRSASPSPHRSPVIPCQARARRGRWWCRAFELSTGLRVADLSIGGGGGAEFSRTHGGAPAPGRPGPPQRRGGPAPRCFIEFASRRTTYRIIGEHDADPRPRVRPRNARQVPHAPHPAIIGGGGAVTPGQTPGVDAARDAGLRPEPRARVGVAAAVPTAVQPIPAARALRHGRADGRAAAAAAAPGLTSPMTLWCAARQEHRAPLTRFLPTRLKTT